MYKILPIILAVFTCLPLLTSAQISVEFSDKDIEQFKKTKTIFFHRKHDDPEVLKKILEEVWTVTPIEVVSYKKIPGYFQEEGYSYFFLDGYWKEDAGIGTAFGLHIKLELQFKEGKGLDKVAEIVIEPQNQRELLDELTARKNEDAAVLIHLYTEAAFENWEMGFLKNYLGCVNQYLEKEKLKTMYSDVDEYENIAKLSKNTLYIPTQDEKQMQKILSNADYEFPYKIISIEEFNDLVVNQKEAIQYAVFNFQPEYHTQRINVLDSQSNQILYSGKNRLISGTLEVLSGKIEKAAKKARKKRK